MEVEKLTGERLTQLIDAKDVKEIRRLFEVVPTIDIADACNEVEDVTKLVFIFKTVKSEYTADLFTELDTDVKNELIRVMSDADLADVIDSQFNDDLADDIEEMPANVVSRMLKAVDNETRRNINTILNYPEDSAGSIMTIEYIDLNANMTVREAFDKIRKEGEDKETINVCYVTDNKKLVGLVAIRDLLLNPYEARIGDIMEEDVISVMTTDDREEVANALSKYDYTALPVVDKENRLVGIVTVDDAIDVLTEEATEDIEKMAAITPSEHPYLRSSVFEIWKQRIPWLMLLMISATFTGMIITKFEDALSVQVALTAFIPMLMDTGGNTGSQASVTIIRGISLGDIEFSDIFAVIWKEFRVSILCGLSLAVVGFGKIMLVDRLLMGNTSISVMVALVVSISLVFTIMIAKFVGCTLPLFAKKLGFDPAVMASPFITTIVDALSLLIYMNVAVLLLHLKL